MKNRSILALTFLALSVVLLSCSKKPTDPDYPVEPGKYEMSIEMEQGTRWYTLVIPDGYDHNQKRPLILAFHPGNASMDEFYNGMKELRDLAAEDNWLMVFPNGVNRTDNRTTGSTWNAAYCCGIARNNDVDDVGFIRALVEQLVQDYKIDEKRIYATGRSNGGMLLHRLGAEMADVFAAIAPFAAAAGGRNPKDGPLQLVEPHQPLPILMMHGLDDPVVRYYGGTGGDEYRYDISFHDTAMIWVTNNKCDSTLADTTLLETELGRSWIVQYPPNSGGEHVVAITVENAGHQVPRVKLTGFDGQQAIFDFFKQHQKN